MVEPKEAEPLGLGRTLIALEEEKTETDKVLERLLDPNNIEHNTELSRQEITAFSVLSTIAKRHNLTALSDFLRANLILRVSKGRAGRKELVRLFARQIQALDEQYIPKPGNESVRRFFGSRR